jgi:hypothetical protein
VTDDELIAKLIAAATAAIENERPGIAYDPGRLRSIMIELTIANGGRAVSGDCYIQRHANISRILGPAAPAPAGQEVPV